MSPIGTQLRWGKVVAVVLGVFALWVGVSGWPQDKRSAKYEVRVEERSGRPWLYRTRHFAVQTDIPREEAEELLQRLETMLVLISKYWGRPNSQSIDMYVVRDIEKWPPGSLDPKGLQSILTGGGVTFGQSRQNSQTGEVLASRAVVYATADHGTPQHEAVHAYCILNFGRTGPTWYSEGMAEMGRYWKDKQDAVICDPEVVQYLKSQPPKRLTDITSPAERTGDYWQNYAWRWALCNLLANNSNYAPRFHPLGMALLNAQRTSFEDVYGPMAEEISFEYELFLKHFDNGYRVDLCSWDWKARFNPLQSRPINAKVKAAAGWQPSRLLVKSGQRIEYSTIGTWSLSKDGEKLTAAGAPDGTGRLVGVLFKDYKLSEPFELGAEGTFMAPSEGKLYLRCRDDWAGLGDNAGEITVKFSKGE